ncbi:YopX family protein [Bacillus licheniformis]|uniref:YopX family protein n=1 Tax=Bacillus licheniformis TaxID=1402 RepID=UPI0003197BFF|nr:YopX family protein [Bacillus licheniformis]AYC51957.1 hypothetical protein C7M53_11910 [Bacillus licheniformis]EQM25374.1 hypothetical protein N399_24290 [Bacillus licheniformis CG-B52]KAA0813097.1 hypothetical protein EI978_08040 [Bacillus licheniformis]KAA0821286.1 hypothetical protein EI973_19050 [Bacillus licheniformis]KAA0826454.1 hypothetical protein EI976_05270 [Bacillus licheniformis]
MREIKFRAWNAPLKKMEYDSLNAIGFDGRVYYGNADITGFFENIMQYTGLKDKNGREIYEKDIAEESYINPMTGKKVVDRYVIEWENGIHKMKYIGNQKGKDRYLWMRFNEVEVIGDVYRNPELLEAVE